MKIRTASTAAAICALLVGAVGCSKPEEAPPTTAPPTPLTASSVVQQATSTIQTQTEAVKTQAEAAKQAVQGAVTNAQAQAAGVSNRVQGIIDQARALVGENKMTEALTLLNSLAGQQLTPAQQSLVQGLKEQIQKAGESAVKAKATDEATKAVGGLLQPKK